MFTLELSVCKDYGIPHSVFIEKWSPEDRAKALAFALESNLRCQLCGTADWEWDENKFAYEPVAVRCHGCYLKDTASDSDKNLPGTTVTLMHRSQITTEMREQWAAKGRR